MPEPVGEVLASLDRYLTRDTPRHVIAAIPADLVVSRERSIAHEIAAALSQRLDISDNERPDISVTPIEATWRGGLVLTPLVHIGVRVAPKWAGLEQLRAAAARQRQADA